MKDKSIVVRLESLERQGVEILASIEVRSKSEMIRQMIRDKLKEKGFPDLSLLRNQDLLPKEENDTAKR